MKDISDEVKFLMLVYDKSKNKDAFHKRLKELYLEGEVTTEAYQVVMQIYGLKPIRTVSKTDFEPCGRPPSSPRC